MDLWIFSWEISLSCSTLYQNAGGSTSEGSVVQRKQCHRHATEAKLTHSLVQGLLLTQILFDNEKMFGTQNLLNNINQYFHVVSINSQSRNNIQGFNCTKGNITNLSFLMTCINTESQIACKNNTTVKQ